MGRITLRQAAAWCGGKIDPKYADVTFLGASNDSRSIAPGQLFLALQGVRDGHDFISKAMENGAAAVLCQHCEEDYPAIIVEDTRLALGAIAREERKRIGMQVVGVTGSVGKSTTKEMIACVLERKYTVEKTPVNHNNDLGMPMAILPMAEDTQVAVLEMGMNHFREIAYLSSIALPDVAVIINVGTMHIEHLGSREGILQAKLEILEGMQPDGKVLLNGDNALLWGVRDTVNAEYFGASNSLCHVLGSNVRQTETGITFDVTRGEVAFSVSLPLEGEHYVSDALAAVNVGLAMGVEPEQIQGALAEFENMPGRQEMLRKKGYSIIKDCYNAGPESMAAALTVLGKRQGRRIAVLGDMLELGQRAPAEHYRIGEIAAKNADFVLAYGPNGPEVIRGAVSGGVAESCVCCFDDRAAMANALKEIAKEGDVMLFKGSHGMHMELVLEQFLQDER